MKFYTRRDLLRNSAVLFGTGIVSTNLLIARLAKRSVSVPKPEPHIRLSLNENAYGPSPSVGEAIRAQLGKLNRYADDALGHRFAEQIAAYEQVAVEQIVLGEILEPLGIFLSESGGPGGEFLYSSPGYLAMIDAATLVGGIGVPVPLNSEYKNDLIALKSRINPKTRAIYLVNPHNPTGTLNDETEFKNFLRDSSEHAVVVVDEAYLEYSEDFRTRSAASLVREGANVVVFRTFDKIYGLAGMPIGYLVAPRPVADALHAKGLGGAEDLGRLNIVAASAALNDPTHVDYTRKAVAKERADWLSVLNELRLPHTDASANFVFFDAGRPQPILADAMHARGVDIGRAHPPYTNWARITIGLPTENHDAQKILRTVLKESSNNMQQHFLSCDARIGA
jgi:histidinol-phosphate aminotransferase